MNTVEAGSVVAPNSGVFTLVNASCELCGNPLAPGIVCQPCALRLLDMVLEDTAASHQSLDDFPVQPELSDERYEHFIVCRRPDGTLWELGRGAMGITYRAFDTNLLCQVTLKIINNALTGDPDAQSRFLREARSAARLRNPHVATILHLGQRGSECFYVMEFIAGETLESLLTRRGDALPPEMALEIIAQTARALAAAHAETLVHRDVKPGNIMLAQHGASSEGIHVKIIDFGLAKPAAESHSAWSDWYFAGTPHYASPEQLAGAMVDARSDLYSLGVVFWHMLAGETVFKTVYASAVCAQGEDKRPDLVFAPPDAWLATLQPAMRALLEEMLQPDLLRRLPTTEALLERCSACREELSSSKNKNINPPGPPGYRQQSVRRRRTRRWIFSLVCAGLLLITGYLLVAGKDVRQNFIARWGGGNRHAKAVEAVQRGQMLSHKGDAKNNDAAIDAFREAIQLDPTLAQAHSSLAMACTQLSVQYGGSAQDLDFALASAERAVALAPRASESHLALATVQILRGAQWESLMELHRALELEPHNPRAMVGFGLQWLMLGYPEKGLPWLLGSARESSNVAYLGAALDAYIDLCADEQAEKCGTRCETMDPSRAITYRQMIHLHMLQGKMTLARQDLLEGSAVGQGDQLFPTLEAQWELYSGNFSKAEVLYRRLYATGYVIPLTYYGSMSYPSILSCLAYKAGQKEEGDRFLREAQALHSRGADGPQAIYDLAAVRCLEGRLEDALTLLRKSLAAGWLDYRSTLLDPRFEALRQEASFIAMMDGLRTKVDGLRKEALARAELPLNIADYPVTTPP